MRLQDLIGVLDEKYVYGNSDIQINNIAIDSRDIIDGSLFICVQGFTADGHDFIQQAVEKGATAVLIDKNVAVPSGIVSIKVASTRSIMGKIASAFYEFPSKNLKMIGITGTNGKTTITYLIEAILNANGYSVARLSTTQYRIGKEQIRAAHTTPDSIELQQLLKKAVDSKCTHLVMEVSSHALSLNRIDGCEFDAAVFTNLTVDHLDFHHTQEEYLDAKTKLFASLGKDSNKGLPKLALINIDSPFAKRIIEAANPALVHVRGYGCEKQTDILASEIETTNDYTTFLYQGVRFRLNLLGRYNVYNALAAIGVGEGEGIGLDVIQQALESVDGVPGRFEMIRCGQPFTVIVDYAHSPDALQNVLLTCKQLSPARIITVFGCGGDRDRTKRPQMGMISGELSNETILTNDNPRTELPEDILGEIEAGIKQTSGSYQVIPDRREAIFYAISSARQGDLVLIAGKGHEDYQIVGEKTIHFDDREVARQALEERRI
ncbi:UDP-N-acetylmuramoyl-L-alanyl-D-glutamate--2,6-diaminopimelate ligase [bacterium]|nr:UDP-N-acetylmuramoyl-L-alanyl-D-glutamate--2,6-diaminopimelate ligase [bacterium]MBU1752298.1 UDP-N-acetylmuramoyl-L-alanyl-D-glutamate--2,6-diaminopimelate ligase [bacterium]